MEYTSIRVTPGEGYTVIELHRPEVMNALNAALMVELTRALEDADNDPAVRCMVLCGTEKAFAAGADIKEMADAGSVEMLLRDQFARWDAIRRLKKPVIAAVSGFALGGGCELALSCDIIIASEAARFGQPEVNIGVMPGAGGTQRLPRAVGKAKAMEMALMGRPITADEAHRRGLVNKVVPAEQLLDEARSWAAEIASKPPVAIRLIKESVLKAMSAPLEDGLAFERKNFYLLFSTEDQKEGMRAFLEKRAPQWKGR